jgi:uncharacterized protein (DUF58 family)
VQLFPTRPAVHVAVAALGAMAVGMAARLPAAVAWGGAMIAGLAWAYAVTRLSVLHLRAAGLEMVWQASRRVRHVARGSVFEVTAELRNRDVAPVDYVALRAVASSELEIEADTMEGGLSPGVTQTVRLSVRAPRIGRHCIHGLALEVRGPFGLFEVPLAFPIRSEFTSPRAPSLRWLPPRAGGVRGSPPRRVRPTPIQDQGPSSTSCASM